MCNWQLQNVSMVIWSSKFEIVSPDEASEGYRIFRKQLIICVLDFAFHQHAWKHLTPHTPKSLQNRVCEITLEKHASYTFLLPTGVMALPLRVIREKKGKMCNSEGLWEFHSYLPFCHLCFYSVLRSESGSRGLLTGLTTRLHKCPLLSVHPDLHIELMIAGSVFSAWSWGHIPVATLKSCSVT